MRVNGKVVLRSEFEYVYRDSSFSVDRKGKLKEKLRGFVDFKLKVAAAEAAGLDTMPSLRSSMDSCRKALSKKYLGVDALEDSVLNSLYKQMKDRRNERVHVAHIFKRLPQNISAYSLRRVETQMDSIYEVLKKRKEDCDFQTYVNRFSDEKTDFWVAPLQMPLEFEQVVWSLQPGGISAPFFTPQGIHIVKLLEKRTLLSHAQLRDEIAFDQRHDCEWEEIVEELVGRLQKKKSFILDKSAVDELILKGYTPRVLFTLAGKPYDGEDFVRFASAYPAGIERQFKAFVEKSVLDSGYLGLESDNPEYRVEFLTYRDSVLCRAISNREVWERHLADEEELRNYFEHHRSRYDWEEPRYKGIVLQCTTKRVARRVRKALKKLSEHERMEVVRIMANADGSQEVQAVQGVFAPGDNAFVDERIFKFGKAVPDGSYPFTVLLGRKVKGPSDYKEIRGQVAVDYCHSLEESWLDGLRAQSKVEINQEVLKTVNNH